MTEPNQTVKVASGINLVLGIWLIIAPWVLDYSDAAARWNDALVGIVVAVMAGIKLSKPVRYHGFSWANAVIGAWLIIAPFALQYGDILSGVNKPLWNDVTVGIFIVVLAWVSASVSSRSDSK